MSTQALIEQLLAEAQSKESAIERERQDFERRQELAKRDIDDMRTAIRVLERREQTVNPKPLPPDKRAALHEPAAAPVGDQQSFIDVVGDAIKGIDTNITTALAFDLLSGAGVKLGDDPRTKISTALSRLEKRGTLVKAVEGGIGRAHVYERPAKNQWRGEGPRTTP